MGKVKNTAGAVAEKVAALAAEISASPEKLEGFITEALAKDDEIADQKEQLEDSKEEITTLEEKHKAEITKLEEKLAKAEETIAELVEANESLDKTAAEVAKTKVKVKGKYVALAIPQTYKRIDGQMVLVNAEYLNENPAYAAELYAAGDSIFEKEAE